MRWRNRRLSLIELHPVSLGMKTGLPQRGRPVLADAGTSEEILRNLQRYSDQFGTKISRENGHGVITFDD